MAARRTYALVCVFLGSVAAADTGISQGPVQVEVFENVQKGSEFDLSSQKPTDRYTENAFGFVRVATKYSENALALDRSTPYVLRATFERAFPAGDRQFRLRARGAAQL